MPQYDTDNMITNAIGNTTRSYTISEVWIIISILLAVIGGIYLYTTYLKKDNKYNGFKKTIYDFLNFKINIIEHTIKISYIILAIYITLSSFTLIPSNFIYFIAVLVLGNIALRLIFEILLKTLTLFKDVSDINKKITKKETKSKLESNKIEETKDI